MCKTYPYPPCGLSKFLMSEFQVPFSIFDKKETGML